MLPLGPPDRHRSPYKSRSAFAAWRGFLAEPAAPVSRAEREAFGERQASWVGVGGAGRDVADQVRFEREWGALRALCRQRGVRIIGDVPIYVAPGSDDHRAHPELFLDGLVAGAPPDALSDDGQLWGNPVYDWPALRRRGYRWWVQRLERSVELFDVARIDHFRGFVAGWVVPGGRARRPPGAGGGARAARCSTRPARELGALPFIAEDLGVITEPVDAAAPRARAAGHGRHAVRLRPRRPPTARIASSTTRPTASPTRAPTTPTRSRAGWRRCATPSCFPPATSGA